MEAERAERAERFDAEELGTAEMAPVAVVEIWKALPGRKASTRLPSGSDPCCSFSEKGSPSPSTLVDFALSSFFGSRVPIPNSTNRKSRALFSFSSARVLIPSTSANKKRVPVFFSPMASGHLRRHAANEKLCVCPRSAVVFLNRELTDPLFSNSASGLLGTFADRWVIFVGLKGS